MIAEAAVQAGFGILGMIIAFAIILPLAGLLLLNLIP